MREHYYKRKATGQVVKIVIPDGVHPKRHKQWLVDLRQGWVVCVAGFKKVSKTQVLLEAL